MILNHSCLSLTRPRTERSYDDMEKGPRGTTTKKVARKIAGPSVTTSPKEERPMIIHGKSLIGRRYK